MKFFRKRKIMRRKKIPCVPYQTSSSKFEKGLRIIFLLLASNFQHPMLKVGSKLFFFNNIPLRSKLKSKNPMHGLAKKS
jgi:hypothetical protein